MFCLSCEDLSDKREIAFIENSDMKGQTFLNGNSRSEDYSPRGSFIQVIPSELRFWQDVRLFQRGREFYPKQFFIGDDTRFLYDSLTNGEYQIKFISHLNDEIVEKVNLINREKIKFPMELGEYYSEIEFKDFSLDKLESKDTLQLLFQHFGCFSFDYQLIEFVFNEEKAKTRIMRRRRKWEELDLIDPIDSLRKFVSQGRKVNGITGCSNYDIYTLRIKGSNEISKIEDGSCKWDGIRIFSNKGYWSRYQSE